MERAIVLPFSIDESGSVYSSSDPKKIWQSRVIAAVMTQFGERVFRPRYGGDIKSAVFENLDEAGAIIQGQVSNIFVSFLPELKLGKVTIVMDPELGTLNVTIYYALPNQDNDEVTLRTGYISRSGDIIQEY